jgi:hypothetical protein
VTVAPDRVEGRTLFWLTTTGAAGEANEAPDPAAGILAVPEKPTAI